MPEAMPDRADSWQFRAVTRIGPSTTSLFSLSQVPLVRTYRENHPIGSNALLVGALDTQGAVLPALTIAGPYIKVKWVLPVSISGEFEFDGRLRILRKGGEFSRDHLDGAGPVPKAVIILDTDYSGHAGWPNNLPFGELHDEFTLLDEAIGEPGDVWYYTVYVGNSLDGRWTFSQEWCLSRNWAYSNELNPVTGDPFSFHGDQLFRLLPRAIQRLDRSEANDAQFRICQVFGRLLDASKAEIDQELKRYRIDDVDAARIPYIDWLIGWPTNFELSENQRRIETKQAVAVWKGKGSTRSTELVLQTLTGWDVELIEGQPWILISNPRQYDPLDPPDGLEFGISSITVADPTELTLDDVHGWTTGNEILIAGNAGTTPDINGLQTITVTGLTTFTLDGVEVTVAGAGGTVTRPDDGDWVLAVNRLPFQTTFDATNPEYQTSSGTWLDRRCYTPSMEVFKGNGGTGQRWQNVNGVLIQLREIPGVSKELFRTVINKVNRFVDVLFPHYAAVEIAAYQVDFEVWDLFGADTFIDQIIFYSPETWNFVAELALSAETPEKCQLFSFPGPTPSNVHVSNSDTYYTLHSALEFVCDPADILEELFLMPQFISLTSDQGVTFAVSTAAVGQFAFNALDYAGTRFFRFRATAFIGGITGGMTVEVSLYDLDNAELVTGSLIVYTGTVPQDKQSGTLTVGSAAGNLKDTLTLYEVRINLTGALDASDFGAVGTADIMVI